MPRISCPVPTFALVLALLPACLPAYAATLTVECEEQGPSGPTPLTVTYEGGEDGTLKLTGAFGEMSFPAMRTDGEVENEGQKVKQTSIYGFGKVSVLMPVKAAIEACIVAKRPAGATDDSPGLEACIPSIPTETIEADGEARLVIQADLPEPSVTIRRAYREVSADYIDRLVGKGTYIAIESRSQTCKPATSP